MYLSRVELNEYRRSTMRALASPEVIHAAVMASFPASSLDGGRILWRIDRVGNVLYLLVQSSGKPDFTHIVEQFGRPTSDQSWETIVYDRHLSAMADGAVVRFRLRANPVHSEKHDGERGKVYAHVTVAQQLEWLFRKSLKCGFTLESDDGALGADIVQRETVKFKRQGKIVSVSMVTFEGILKITDEDLFRNAMVNGIGRAKAYGCGLITTMRV